MSWNPPQNEGSAVTSYEVVLPPGHQVTVGGQTTSHAFTGLNNGLEYTATVRATNAFGQGPISPPSRPDIPYGPPSPVRNVQATLLNLGESRATVTWEPPNNINGRDIAYYMVWVCNKSFRMTWWCGSRL